MDGFSIFSKQQRDQALQNIWVRCGIVLGPAGVFSLLIWHYNWPSYLYSIPLTLLSIIGYSIFEARAFHNFLYNTMLGIIQDSQYLKNLNREKLESMLDRLHRVYYGLPEEMGPNNLYQFIKDNILDRHIGEAYIQGMEITQEFQNHPTDGYYIITNMTNFRIVSSRDGETKGKCPIKLIVSPVPERSMEDHFPLDEWFIETARGETDTWEREDLSRGEIREYGFHYDLEFNITRESPLNVRTRRVGYEQAHERTAHQTFGLPTHGVTMTVIVHDFQDVRFDCRFDGIPPSEARKVPVSDRRYLVEFNGWMIPGNSITITF